jgi:hypothetical protein
MLKEASTPHPTASVVSYWTKSSSLIMAKQDRNVSVEHNQGFYVRYRVNREYYDISSYFN